MITDGANYYQSPFFTYNINNAFDWTKTKTIFPIISASILSFLLNNNSPFDYLLCYCILNNLNTLIYIVTINYIVKEVKI